MLVLRHGASTAPDRQRREIVDGDSTELVAAVDTHRCPVCQRSLPISTLTCPEDGVALLGEP